MVGPDFGAVGSSQLDAIVGALLTYGLIISVLMEVTCGATWATPLERQLAQGKQLGTSSSIANR